jgi:hypothetical protein
MISRWRTGTRISKETPVEFQNITLQFICYAKYIHNKNPGPYKESMKEKYPFYLKMICFMNVEGKNRLSVTYSKN